jgi:hypothetical protein
MPNSADPTASASANAAAIGLFALAASAAVAGLGSVLGYPGIGLGALLVFLVGNPLSAVSSAPELLPEPWGQVGQWLPVGAGGAALRSAAYFDWAGATQPISYLSDTPYSGLRWWSPVGSGWVTARPGRAPRRTGGRPCRPADRAGCGRSRARNER